MLAKKDFCSIESHHHPSKKRQIMMSETKTCFVLRSMKEFKVVVLAALDARGVSVDELVALGLLNAQYYPRYPPPKSSGKRKALDAPTQAPSYAEDLVRKANKLASLPGSPTTVP
jgi:hypothetical protein